MSDAKPPPMTPQQLFMLSGQKCVCGLYHVEAPHLLFQYEYEYDRATPERQREMLDEIKDANRDTP